MSKKGAGDAFVEGKRFALFARELRTTARLAFPLAAAQVAVMAMGLVDTAIVGHYQTVTLAGVGLGHMLSMGMLVFGFGLAHALEPLIAQALGAGELGRARAWTKTGERVALPVGIPLALGAIGIAAASHAVGVDADIRDEAVVYLIARFPGNVLQLVFLASRSVLQSQQRAAPLFVAALVANVFNALANVALVDGLVTWGAAGSGLATSLAMAVMTFMTVRASRTGPLAEAAAADTTPEPKVDLRLLFRLSWPLGVQLAAEFWVFTAAGLVASTLGKVPGAANTIALQCTSFTFMFSVGIASATSARVGRAIGEGHPELARPRLLAGALLAGGVMGLSAVLFLTLATPIAALFGSGSGDLEGGAATIALAAQLLVAAAFYQLFDGTQAVMSGARRGAGDVRFPFVLTVAAYWGVGFPVALGLAFAADLGAVGLWYGLGAGLAAAAIALTARFLWVTRKVLVRLEPATD